MTENVSVKPGERYGIEYVDEFSDAFTRQDDDCDVHGLKPHTIIILKEELTTGDPQTHVVVRGEHPWEYRHYTTISKSQLKRERLRIKRKYEDDEHIQHVLESWASVEAIAEEVAATVTNDNNATPHTMSISDYNVWIEVIEQPTKYRVMVGWEPE